jgi:hypothetical protein
MGRKVQSFSTLAGIVASCAALGKNIDGCYDGLSGFGMNDFPILQQKTLEDLFLVGFRIDPAADGPQFFTLFALGGENERPITTVGDRIVFFRRPQLAKKALQIGDPTMQALGEPPEELEMLCDVAQAMYLVNSEDSDEDRIILDCLEILDDLVRATRLSMPPLYQEALSDLVEHLMKTRMYGEHLRDHGSRERLEDALLWCVGAVTMKAKMIIE